MGLRKNPSWSNYNCANRGWIGNKNQAFPAEQGKDTYGVYADAYGNMRSKTRHFRHKLEEWLTKIEDGHLPRRAVWTDFFGTIWRTIVHALPVTTLTMK